MTKNHETIRQLENIFTFIYFWPNRTTDKIFIEGMPIDQMNLPPKNQASILNKSQDIHVYICIHLCLFRLTKYLKVVPHLSEEFPLKTNQSFFHLYFFCSLTNRPADMILLFEYFVPRSVVGQATKVIYVSMYKKVNICWWWPLYCIPVILELMVRLSKYCKYPAGLEFPTGKSLLPPPPQPFFLETIRRGGEFIWSEI